MKQASLRTEEDTQRNKVWKMKLLSSPSERSLFSMPQYVNWPYNYANKQTNQPLSWVLPKQCPLYKRFPPITFLPPSGEVKDDPLILNSSYTYYTTQLRQDPSFSNYPISKLFQMMLHPKKVTLGGTLLFEIGF